MGQFQTTTKMLWRHQIDRENSPISTEIATSEGVENTKTPLRMRLLFRSLPPAISKAISHGNPITTITMIVRLSFSVGFVFLLNQLARWEGLRTEFGTFQEDLEMRIMES